MPKAYPPQFKQQCVDAVLVSQVQYVSSSLGTGIYPAGGIQEAVFKQSRLNQLDLKSRPPQECEQ